MKFLKEHYAIVILVILGFILRLYFAHLDPYLHEWDERFHALVARNLMDDPFLPLLRSNPIVPYDATSWCCNSVWLHKQPLFMWQMALSMKLFGVNEFAMRYPSVLLGSLMLLLLYRITFLLTRNKFTAFLASLLLCVSNYHLEMISGQIGMDHNDVAFGFYILASFWTFAEYIQSNKLKWALGCGVFAGMAILNKWLVGSLVFVPFGWYAIMQLYTAKSWTAFKHMFLAIGCCLLVFGPWQLYILYRFPELAQHEYAYNSKHLWEAVEGHVGGNAYYFGWFNEYFGRYLWILILPGMLLPLVQRRLFVWSQHASILLGFAVPLLFFSLVAQTKLPSYFFIAVPFGMLFIAISINRLLQYVPVKFIHGLVVLALVYWCLNPESSVARRKNAARDTLLHNTKIYKSLSSLIPDSISIVTNINSFEDVDVMFYNKKLTAYHWWIDVQYLDSLKQKKVWLAAFKDHGGYSLPPEYANYPYLHRIDTLLK